jgi:hypothetical protein
VSRGRALLLFAALLFTKPDGGRLWLLDSQIVGVLELKGVGAAPTAIVTLGGTFFVREPPETVAVTLGWKPKP